MSEMMVQPTAGVQVEMLREMSAKKAPAAAALVAAYDEAHNVITIIPKRVARVRVTCGDDTQTIENLTPLEASEMFGRLIVDENVHQIEVVVTVP